MTPSSTEQNHFHFPNELREGLENSSFRHLSQRHRGAEFFFCSATALHVSDTLISDSFSSILKLESNSENIPLIKLQCQTSQKMFDTEGYNVLQDCIYSESSVESGLKLWTLWSQRLDEANSAKSLKLESTKSRERERP
ncbi:hypothetical protein AVEN_130533-1 [Araneus ventricosus]|uniref:Uncharacterized protein n=1 Tax=Araneus ventricosus TaxID=182803 RepID=A0A4Y2J440_ARAVE|nr:hypothetical protein AVEN_130533-1 [Araneus ventricosus]